MSPDELFERYQQFAKTFAATLFRTMPPEVLFDELHAAALEGVWRAAQTFKDKGVRFVTHARLCARRCMIDWLRKAHRKRGRRNWRAVPLSLSVWVQEQRDKRLDTDAANWHTWGSIIPDYRRTGQQEIDDKDEMTVLLKRYKEPLRSLLQGYFVDGLNVNELAKKHHTWPSEISRRLSTFIQRAGGGYNGKSVA